MSMNSSNPKRSICEVIREINDLNQGDSAKAKVIRKRCAEAEGMAKRMFEKMLEMGKKLKIKVWIEWEELNPDWREDKERRESKGYKSE